MDSKMLIETKAYQKLKEQVREVFDFIIVTSSAIPNLKKTINYIENKTEGFAKYGLDYKLAKPKELKIQGFDEVGFTDIDIDRLNRVFKNKGGQNEDKSKSSFHLGKFILLTSFSYFENYVQSVIQELIEFHECYDYTILKVNTKKTDIKPSFDEFQSYAISLTEAELEARKKITAPYEKNKEEQYEKYSKILSVSTFFKPSILLGDSGKQYIIQNLKENKSNLSFDLSRAADIPDILKNLFYIDIDKPISALISKVQKENEKTIKEIFHNARQERNKIAHGDVSSLTLNEVIEINHFLKKFAIIVDKHLISHYFCIEKYFD